MSAVRTAAGALLRSRDRATSALTVAAFALPHAFLLAVTGGVMAFGARAAEAAASGAGDDPSTLDGMGPFYVILAYFAATLLIVPIISMGAAAARLGMSRRERDLAVLRLMGLAPGATKLACILETCVSSSARSSTRSRCPRGVPCPSRAALWGSARCGWESLPSSPRASP